MHLYLMIVLAFASPAGETPALGGETYEIVSWTLDGGGGASSGTDASENLFALTGTVGQPDAGASAGGGYELTGGFWPDAGSVILFGDGFESGDTSSWSVSSP